jgi:hypothetical protein
MLGSITREDKYLISVMFVEIYSKKSVIYMGRHTTRNSYPKEWDIYILPKECSMSVYGVISAIVIFHFNI